MHDYLTYNQLSSCHTDFLEKVSTTVEPTSYHQATKDPLWVQAMGQELAALDFNPTWHLVARPTDRNVIGSRWVFKDKHKSNGDVERLKTRLVA